ncbi:glycosyltransferase family 4 protein [Auraticoccus monumenti]|uniref:Glycosyltransferase involved in cell wall bisynthesis n=1 Tax=Auraticoccus monumenti TaxID=675864 RepID=A0A1G6VWN7_9ACTN|nr:glycosyltransferase family 4 protein [Auraticoccus monumenti]SDD57225.1 Glycosyltransferase involved in cell wall bisynthesis [Auraticoccus monumenti]
MTTRTVLVAHPGAELYGSDRMVLESMRALTTDTVRPVLVVPRRGPLLEEAANEGHTVLICPTPVISKSALGPHGLLDLLRTTLRSLLPGWRLLRSVDPAVVVVNTVTPPLWLLLARLRGVPTISHVHEGEASASRLVQRLLYLPLTLASSIVVNSEFSLGVLSSAAPWLARRSEVVLNAVEGPPQVVPPRERVEGAIRLLFVGRLSARKGPHVAVEAVGLLRDRGVPVTLGLLGSASEGYEWYEQQLRDAVHDRKLTEQVHFHGFQPRIWDLVRDADVVLVPSTVDEPFGNTAVEARLAARPLVVSDISGLREASAGKGSVRRVPPSDPVALADAVESLRDGWDEERGQALAGAADARDRFSSARYASRLRSAVDRLRKDRR